MPNHNPDKVVSVTVLVATTPDKIFALLADPRKHQLFDGSGSIQNARTDSPDRLSLGATFGMDMKIGMKYKITNEVVEFDEGKQIAWRHFGGHIWRYLLEATEGGTLVTEQFDWNGSKSQTMIKVMNYPRKNKKSIEATLAGIQKIFTI